MKFKTIFKENTILRVLYLLVFLFIITNEAIYSPDTRSYLNAMPYRHPGYVLFLKSFEFIFSRFFDISVLAFQGAFGLIAVHFFFKKSAQIFNLHTISKVILFLILMFPFFSPLYVANNICPEGISYALYLFFIASSLDFIQHENYKKLWIALAFYVLLSLTRGQFIFTPLIFAFIYIIKNKKQLLKKSIIIKFLMIMLIPVFVILADSSYHKLKDGIFGSTPFGFVAASGSAFFVSEQSNVDLIKNEDDKTVFELCYNKLSQEQLLLSSQSNLNSYTDYYDFFHKNVPPICNGTVHELGKNYYYQKAIINEKSTNYLHAQAYFKIEKTCRNLTLLLIKNNFNSWSKLYYANLSHGFYSSYLLILVVLIFIISFVKFLFNCNHKWYSLLFVCSSVTLSNAMLIAFASHSIIRYLFYNYIFIFLIFVILTKLIKNGIKN